MYVIFHKNINVIRKLYNFFYLDIIKKSLNGKTDNVIFHDIFLMTFCIYYPTSGIHSIFTCFFK